jgi:hypothetical protein
MTPLTHQFSLSYNVFSTVLFLSLFLYDGVSAGQQRVSSYDDVVAKVQSDLAKARVGSAPNPCPSSMKPAIDSRGGISYSARVYTPPHHSVSSDVRGQESYGYYCTVLRLSSLLLLLIVVLQRTSGLKKMRQLRHFYS